MWDVLLGGNHKGGRGMLSCACKKRKCPGNEGEMGDRPEQMRARDVTACACCVFVMFREKGKEITRGEKLVYIFSKCICSRASII